MAILDPVRLRKLILPQQLSHPVLGLNLLSDRRHGSIVDEFT